MKLTQKEIDRLQHPVIGQQLIWDSDPPGFGVRVSKTSKSFFVQGRVNQTHIRITIGRYGVFNLTQARQKAKAILRDMAFGVDPRGKIAKTTLYEVVGLYAADRQLKQRTINDVYRHLNSTFVDWKDKEITCISRDMVLKRFRKCSTKSKAQANQAFRVLRAVLNYAQATIRPGGAKVFTENPVKVLSDARMWHQVAPREISIPISEVGAFWKKLRCRRSSLAPRSSSAAVLDATSLVLLTGARKSEIIELEWNDINFLEKTWRIKDPKNKKGVTMPLSLQALEILSNRHRMDCNPYVFWSTGSKTGHIGTGTIRDATQRLYGIGAHDLRRTFVAIGGTCNIELYKIKLLLNHKPNGDVTITHYVQTSDLSWLNKEINLIGSFIEREAGY